MLRRELFNLDQVLSVSENSTHFKSSVSADFRDLAAASDEKNFGVLPGSSTAADSEPPNTTPVSRPVARGKCLMPSM